MKRIIKETDKFIVQSESIITSFDRKVITRLYQPLLGATSASLYFTLQSEIEFDNTISKEKREIQTILKLMNIPVGDLLLAISKLEGLGLVRSQYNKTNDYYVFSLFAPLSPKDFFDNPLFDSLLAKQLGKSDYQKNKMYFTQSKINNSDLEDISDDFNDVFSYDPYGSYEGGENVISKKVASANIKFNFNAFYLKLEELHVSKEACKRVENDIALIALANKVSAVDMANLIHKSLTKEGYVDLAKLRNLCSTGKVESKVSSKSVDTGNINLNKKLELYNKVSPYEFLLIKNNYAPIALSDKKIIDLLINEYRLPLPVINVLVDYVLQTCDNKINRGYIEKIAGSLARSKIADSYSAMNYLNRSVISKPSTEKKKEVKEEVSDEEIAKALKELEELKKARD